MKKLLKITSVLLIQAFLAVDFAWCGVNAASPGDSATTLSPNLIINDESFHGMVLAKSISFENTGGINKEKILSLRQSPAITKTLLKELIRKKNAIGYMLALLELERQGVDCVREINEGFRELDRINDPRKCLEYAQLVVEMFAAKRLSDKEAKRQLGKLLKKIKKNVYVEYFPVIFSMLDNGLISRKQAETELGRRLEQQIKNHEDYDYCRCCIGMIERGLITSSADRNLDYTFKIINDFNCKERSFHFGKVMLALFRQGGISESEILYFLGKTMFYQQRCDWYDKFVALFVEYARDNLNGPEDLENLLRTDRMFAEAYEILQDPVRISSYQNMQFLKGEFAIILAKKGLITEGEACSRLQNILSMVRDINDVYGHAMLVLSMLENKIDQENAGVHLQEVIEKTLTGNFSPIGYSQLVKLLLENRNVSPEDKIIIAQFIKKKLKICDPFDEKEVIKAIASFDVYYLKNLESEKRRTGLPYVYLIRSHQLGRELRLDSTEAEGITREAVNLMALVEKTNQGASRTEQQINVKHFAEMYLQGLANLQYISPAIAKEIVSNRCQRGFLPFLEDDIRTAAGLTLKEVKIIRERIAAFKAGKNREKKRISPAQVMNIINFAIAYRGISLEAFQSAMNAGNKEQALFLLAKGLVDDLSRRLGVSLGRLNYDDMIETLRSWNFFYLGEMVRASRMWGENERGFFRLVLRASLENKFKALLLPQENPGIGVKDYSWEERELIARVRGYNRRFMQEAAGYGINLASWLHPDTMEPRMTREGQPARDRRVVFKDFQEHYLAFNRWLADYLEGQDNDLGEKLNRQFLQAEKSLGPVRNALVKNNDFEFDPAGIFRQKNNLIKLHKFLEKLEALFPGHVPAAVADLLNSIEEIQVYELPKTSGPAAFRMRFWSRLPGRDAFIAGQVGSCTALDTNASAIMEYLLDLGTVYLILEDPVTKREKGYVRFFAALNEKNEPIITIDSADGVANAGGFDPIPEALEFIKDFAGKCNIPRAHVRIRSGKQKIGGALTGYYMHHVDGIKIPVSEEYYYFEEEVGISDLSPGPEDKVRFFEYSV